MRSLKFWRPGDKLLYDFKAAFGRAGCGRLASLAVLAGQPHDASAEELREELAALPDCPINKGQ